MKLEVLQEHEKTKILSLMGQHMVLKDSISGLKDELTAINDKVVNQLRVLEELREEERAFTTEMAEKYEINIEPNDIFELLENSKK
jgi:hypothetical protein